MTKPLSPATQKVLNAATSVCHPETEVVAFQCTRLEVAAALRAVVEQVVPKDKYPSSDWTDKDEVRYQLLAIAAELAEKYEAEANNPPEGHPDPEPFQLMLRARAATLRAALPQPEPQGPSVEVMAQIVYENAMLATAPEHAKPHWPSWNDLPNSDARIHSLNTAEIILARWGRPAIAAELALPEPQGPTAWMYRGEPDFDGERWRENWKVTLDEKLARYKSGNKEPVPLWGRPAIGPVHGVEGADA